MTSNKIQEEKQKLKIDRMNQSVAFTPGFMKQLIIDHNSSDSFSLFALYCYHVQVQGTHQIYATNSFMMKGLKWGRDRFYKAKKLLEKLNYIENIRASTKTGTIGKPYVKLNFVFPYLDEDLNYLFLSDPVNNHTTDLPQCGRPHSVETPHQMLISKDSKMLGEKNSEKESKISNERIKKQTLNKFSKEYQYSREFRNAWFDWIDHILELTGKGYSTIALNRFVASIDKKKKTLDDILEAIDHSITQNCRSICYPNNYNNKIPSNVIHADDPHKYDDVPCEVLENYSPGYKRKKGE